MAISWEVNGPIRKVCITLAGRIDDIPRHLDVSFSFSSSNGRTMQAFQYWEVPVGGRQSCVLPLPYEPVSLSRFISFASSISKLFLSSEKVLIDPIHESIHDSIHPRKFRPPLLVMPLSPYPCHLEMMGRALCGRRAGNPVFSVGFQYILRRTGAD